MVAIASPQLKYYQKTIIQITRIMNSAENCLLTEYHQPGVCNVGVMILKSFPMVNRIKRN